MSEDNKDLVPVPPAPPPAPTTAVDPNLLGIFSAETPMFLTNLPLDTPWGVAVLSKAQGPGDTDLSAIWQKVFKVKYWLAHVVEFALGDTGEIVKRIRCVLIDEEANTLAWSSQITTRYWATIYVGKGPGPWEPTIDITWRRHAGKKQGYWYQPVLAIPEAPKKKGK